MADKKWHALDLEKLQYSEEGTTLRTREGSKKGGHEIRSRETGEVGESDRQEVSDEQERKARPIEQKKKRQRAGGGKGEDTRRPVIDSKA